jgi:hypothetical protein
MIDRTTEQIDQTADKIEEQTKGSKKKRAVVPVAIASVGALAIARRVFKGSDKNGGPEFKTHAHGALQHDHPHVHVTHERTDADAPVGGWTHLTAEHSHRHNHTSVEHSHRPHQDVESEHLREAHVHDHEHPTT